MPVFTLQKTLSNQKVIYGGSGHAWRWKDIHVSSPIGEAIERLKETGEYRTVRGIHIGHHKAFDGVYRTYVWWNE